MPKPSLSALREQARNFFSRLPSNPSAADDRAMQQLAKKIIKESQTELETIPVSDLKLEEVELYLKLKETDKDCDLAIIIYHSTSLLQWKNTYSTLESVLKKIDCATLRTDRSESIIRLTIDMLLIYAHHIVVSDRPAVKQYLSVQTERKWAYGPVDNSGKRIRLVGNPDYAVWYGQVEDIDVNVIVFEAKRRGNTSLGLAQCLGYMGIVHQLRKEAGKRDCTIWGMVSDDWMFCALKINNNSEWSYHYLNSTKTRKGEYGQVLGLLVHFLKYAAEMSPLHSKESSAQGHSQETSAHHHSQDTSTSPIYAGRDEVLDNYLEYSKMDLP
ncbi:hypothetical protein N7456_007425 [Penicillium angulare]|uniref:Uncharacterized protein n=1 Tax=Penicillium angulare TaxID=116970 RepID=A0A9W9K862_9EURO|nr:hypothetical protein N7456_007425 [Penicillium angulare]